jgi:hypothetical protein
VYECETKKNLRGKVPVLSRDVLAFYATAFTRGDVKKALVYLGKTDRQAGREDV